MLPGFLEGFFIVHQALEQGGDSQNQVRWQAVGAADFDLRPQADFGKERGQVQIPIGHVCLMALVT